MELFFDLVFVAVIGVITHDLSHIVDGHIAIKHLLRFPLVFIPVWWVWITHTLYANRHDQDVPFQRFFNLALMGLMIVLSTFSDSDQPDSFYWFAGIYAFVRLMLAGAYTLQYRNPTVSTKEIALAIFIGGVISASSVAASGIERFLLFYLGIAIDMVWQFYLRHTGHRLVHRAHLVERLGLLAIIILGESVIAMVGGLSIHRYSQLDLLGTVSGFVMVGAIWWCYFDQFSALERAKRLIYGNSLIFPHLFLCAGLLILANLIRHIILDDLDKTTFDRMAVTGLTLFYLGKQVPYWVAFPPWRIPICINTAVCIGLTVFSTFMPNIEYSLLGMTIGMLVYVYSTFRWVITRDIQGYLD